MAQPKGIPTMINPRRLSIALFLMSLLLPILAGATPPTSSTGAHAQFYPSPDPVLKNLPFSEAVRAGDLLILSGQIGSLPGKMALAPGGITGESRQMLENISAILQRHGATLRDVVQCTVFLADMKVWPAFNKVYTEFFKPPYPARSATGATGLALGAKIEMQCTAYAPVKK
jgi:2-iminobutanoate/2-iminopropanoate deaminase